ncbi:MAG: RNA polymerase sigma factor [Actinomycetota bacterium]
MVEQSEHLHVAKAGADLEFQVFFRAWYPRLARAALLLSGNRLEAEDIAQEAFVRVYERWETVRNMASPAGYLFRTALNLNRKRIRWSLVRRRLLFAREPDSDPSSAVEAKNRVLTALSSLPAGQRQALVLVEWLGLDPEEAGRILGIKAATVRVRMHRGRSALRRQFGEEIK